MTDVEAVLAGARVLSFVREEPRNSNAGQAVAAMLNRFAHTGFVTAIDDRGVHTVEGNTNDGGSRDGWGVFERTRTFGPKDRFVRWSAA